MKKSLIVAFLLGTCTACSAAPKIEVEVPVVLCRFESSKAEATVPVTPNPKSEDRATQRLDHAVRLITDLYKQRHNQRRSEKRMIKSLSKRPGLSANEKVALDKALERLEKEDLLDYYELIKALNHLDGLHNMDWP